MKDTGRLQIRNQAKCQVLISQKSFFGQKKIVLNRVIFRKRLVKNFFFLFRQKVQQ